LNNYWCDLTVELAKNGAINSARPIALAAMLILCSSLIAFWYYLPLLFKDFKFNPVIRYCGISSMIVAIFLFTGFHDTVINISGALGFLAFTATFIGLYKNKFYSYFIFGLFCLILMITNYFIYQSNYFISFLPILQKATFISFLLLICLIDIKIFRTNQEIRNKK